MSDVDVTARLQVLRDSLVRDLQSSISELRSFADQAKNIQITVPLTLDTTQVRLALDRLQMEVQANPLRIPVVLDQGGGGGGGGWRGALSEVAAGYANGVSAVGDGYRGFMAARAIPGGKAFSNPGSFLTGTDYASRYVPGYDDIESAAAMEPEQAAYAEAAAARAGGRAGPRLMNGMMGRMLMMEAARLPIQQIEKQMAARQKLFGANATGTARQSFEAEIGVLQSDSEGLVGAVASPFYSAYGYHPGQMLAGLQQSQGNTDLMQLRMSMRQSATQSQFGIDIANAGGDTQRQSQLRRQATYDEALKNAQKAHAEAIDQANLGGKREAMDRQLGEAIGRAHVSGGYGAYGFTDTQAVAAARSNYNGQIAGLNRAKSDIDTAYQKAIQEASANLSAGNTEDAAHEGILDIRNRGSVASIGLSGREALAGASGTRADQLAAYNEKLSDQVKLLHQVADETQKVNQSEAKRMRELAAAQEKANPELVEARRYQMQAQADSAFGGIQSSASAYRAGVARFGGDMAGAAGIMSQQRAMDRKTALGAQKQAGLLSDDEYSRGMAIADQTALVESAEAHRAEGLRLTRISSEINELAVASPYARALRHISNERDAAMMADPAHEFTYLERYDAQKGALDYSHNLDLQSIRNQRAVNSFARGGERYSFAFRAGHNPQKVFDAPNPGLAKILAQGNQMDQEIAKDQGDPEKQRALIDLYRDQLRDQMSHATSPKEASALSGFLQHLSAAEHRAIQDSHRDPNGDSRTTDDDAKTELGKAAADLAAAAAVLKGAQALYVVK